MIAKCPPCLTTSYTLWIRSLRSGSGIPWKVLAIRVKPTGSARCAAMFLASFSMTLQFSIPQAKRYSLAPVRQSQDPSLGRRPFPVLLAGIGQQ